MSANLVASRAGAYVFYNVKRLLSDWSLLAFGIGLPVVLYLVFGATLTDMDVRLAHGKFAAYVMISMAVYGGINGSAVAYAFRSPTAVSIAATALVPLAFFGNMFAPISPTMLKIGMFTPMYGPPALSRYWLTDGAQSISQDPWFVQHDLWIGIVNMLVWAAVFALATALLRRRTLERQ